MKAEVRVLRSALMFERLRKQALQKSISDASVNGDAAHGNTFIPSISQRAEMSFKAPLRPDKFEPDAVDADNDGMVQDGTPFERPVVASRITARIDRRVRKSSSLTSPVTDTEAPDFKKSTQTAVNNAKARAENLKKPSRRVFSGRQRTSSQRRRLLDGSKFAQYPGVRRLFKSRDDAHSELRESVLRTVTDMKALAEAGQLTGKNGRRLDPQVVEYFKRSSPEKIWDDLEKAAIKLRESVEKMPLESRTKADLSELILQHGLLGDPSTRVKREDLKTPWIIGRLSEVGHELTDEDKRMLEMNGLVARDTGRGEIYESMREILEQAMGFNGALDRKGRPVYGYMVTPSPRTTEEIGGISEVGRRLYDTSNGPNLVGYSDTSLVRLRPSTKDRSGFSYGDSLRNGILPQRINGGDDKDTVLAVVHDRDFTDTKMPDDVASEMRDVQRDYMLGLIEWRLSGDSSSLTRNDYIEAVVPYDVSPDEIEEMVIATDALTVFRDELDTVEPMIIEAARAAGMKQSELQALTTFLQNQTDGWNEAVRRVGGESEKADFRELDQLLKKVLQLHKGQELKKLGEDKGIKMTVGPRRMNEPQTFEEALEALVKRFNP